MSTLYLNGWQVSAALQDRRIVAENTVTHEITQVALFNLQKVVCIGTPHLTTPLLHQLLRNDIPVLFLSGKGRWLGTLNPQRNENPARRLRQYRSTGDVAFALKIAKALIDAKIQNMHRMLQRWSANRKQTELPSQKAANQFLRECLRKLQNAATLDEARGFEGIATACYFDRMDDFLPKEMPFVARSRRPPRNPVNALLSWTYAIVTAELEATLRTCDLDPAIGFLHAVALGRPALALDLLEPLRAPLCDALAIRLVNHRILTQKDFEKSPKNDGFYLNDLGKRTFFKEYEETMERVFVDKISNVPTTFRKTLLNLAYEVCHALEKNEDFKPFLTT